VRNQQHLASVQVGTDVRIEYLFVVLVWQHKADQVRPCAHLRDRLHLESIGLSPVPAGSIVPGPNPDFAPAVTQIGRVRSPLDAVADYGNTSTPQKYDIGVGIIIHLWHAVPVRYQPSAATG
jgi:hypothetical protein